MRDKMATTNSKPTKTEQSLFEEDDEFEEFPAEGEQGHTRLLTPGSVTNSDEIIMGTCSDWRVQQH